MALEDLTGTKYINSLNASNPVTGDKRYEGDDHLRGVKNVLLTSFPNVDAEVTATPAEFNVLVGETSLPGGFASGTEMVFYTASAPTGWTQDTTTTNLDGSTIRVTTATGGGAVSGTDDLASPPDPSHTHTDTLYDGGYLLTGSYIPAHWHYMFESTDSTDSTPNVTSITELYQRNNSSNNYRYDMDTNNTTGASIGRTSSSGSGGTHTHTLSGSVTSETLTAFAPKHVQVILCSKD